MWGPLAIRAEIARAEETLASQRQLQRGGAGQPSAPAGGHMGGISMDLWKYYDLVDAPVAIGFLERLGLHQGVATALRAFYTSLWRMMSINGACAPGFTSKQSVLQGCAWSNPCAAAIAVAWSGWVEEQGKVHTYT